MLKGGNEQGAQGLFGLMDAPIAPTPDTRQMALDGMARAAEHADAVDEGWSDRAYSALREYALKNDEFMTEDVRVWAHRNGLPTPPDGRAWGAVTLRAVKANLVVCDRYRKTRIPPAHATPRPVWRSRIFGAEAA